MTKAQPKPAQPKPPTLDQLLADARLPERTVPICLRADLTARMQELQRKLEEAEQERRSVNASLASGGSHELAEQMAKLRQEMLDHSVNFRMRALPRREFTKLQTEFPPREGVASDQQMGYDFEGLVDVLVRRCAVEPELTEEQWARLDDVLSDAQWQTLQNAAWAVNARDVDVPFSPIASRVLLASEDE